MNNKEKHKTLSAVILRENFKHKEHMNILALLFELRRSLIVHSVLNFCCKMHNAVHFDA